MKNKKPFAVLCLLVLAALALAVSYEASVTVSANLNAIGGIATSPGIGVFADAACTVAATSVDWGALAPGGTTNQTVYVKNTGTAAETLMMTNSNWNPAAAANYLNCTWNQQSTVLNPGQSADAVLTLCVLSTVTGITSFSFTITISATG